MSENTQNTEPKKVTPMDLLRKFPNAPSENQINAWKMQVPGGRLHVFTPDGGKRVFVVRGISGIELDSISKQLQAQNMSDPERELQLKVAATAVMWASTTKDGLLDENTLRGGTAGLPLSLYLKVQELSDFVPPEALEFMSAEL